MIKGLNYGMNDSDPLNTYQLQELKQIQATKIQPVIMNILFVEYVQLHPKHSNCEEINYLFEGNNWKSNIIVKVTPFYLRH